jgi:hypothetical protein
MEKHSKVVATVAFISTTADILYYYNYTGFIPHLAVL